jgi:hypothetical protein
VFVRESRFNREPEEGVARLPMDVPSETAESASPIAFARFGSDLRECNLLSNRIHRFAIG